MPWTNEGTYVATTGGQPEATTRQDASASDAGPVTIDLLDVPSPITLLRANAALGRLRPGDKVMFLTRDPRSVMEFEALAGKTGHTLIEQVEISGGYGHLFQCR
ncbi:MULTISPECIES: sulfurtransferase TusA family protein [Ramlibacter]|uniref:UPF0033 domain-containing protein n=1 Tax=Ramlibacter pinisoli TaxID=2682844 RepID=A0A6N8ITF0_9BURK|nr:MULTISPECIES: sulfurtransferase TusA family protein [Ramlibacter]MBA2965143.1 sulfurtransferase TusA family protein [Ramlibacter sp. CGMCC 1.13660]MVQ30108.1 hypothetical protein [Ramlibacter pinisoli]